MVRVFTVVWRRTREAGRAAVVSSVPVAIAVVPAATAAIVLAVAAEAAGATVLLAAVVAAGVVAGSTVMRAVATGVAARPVPVVSPSITASITFVTAPIATIVVVAPAALVVAVSRDRAIAFAAFATWRWRTRHSAAPK